MFIINFSKLIKIWRNSKNRIVSVNKLEHEKDDDVKIIVEGKFKGKEEDVSKPPKWFKEFETKINKKITKLNENFENKTPKWFKDWNQKTFIPFKEKVEKDIIIMKQEIVEIKKDIVVMKKDIVNIKKDIIIMKQEIVEIKKDIVVMKKDIVVMKKDITAMKNTPTMKKELGLS